MNRIPKIVVTRLIRIYDPKNDFVQFLTSPYFTHPKFINRRWSLTRFLLARNMSLANEILLRH